MKLIPLLLVGFISSSYAKVDNNAEETVTYIKCYVGLTDGSRTVSFWYAQQSSVKTFSSEVIGDRVPNIKDIDMTVTEVYQCIEGHKKFSDSRARVIEDKQIR